MTQTPTDALRLVPDDYVLVPREPTGSMLKAAFAAMNATPSGTWKRMKAEARHPIQIFNAKMRPRWSAMIGAAPSPRQIPWQHRQIEDDGVGGYRYKAAPASPLPGGGDWIDGTPTVPVGSPTWCGWASYEIRRLRAELPAAPTGAA